MVHPSIQSAKIFSVYYTVNSTKYRTIRDSNRVDFFSQPLQGRQLTFVEKALHFDCFIDKVIVILLSEKAPWAPETKIYVVAFLALNSPHH